MRKTILNRAILNNLRDKIAKAEERKRELKNYVKELHEKYSRREISYSFYIETLYRKFDGRDIHEWIEHFDDYIRDCKKRLKGETRKSAVKHVFLFIVSAIVLLAILTYGFNIRPSFSGFAVREGENLAPAENITGQNITTINESYSDSGEVSQNETGLSQEEPLPISEEINITQNQTSELAPEIILEENITTDTANIISLENVDISTTLATEQIRLGEAVKWKKIVSASETGNLTIPLPNEAENITVVKVKDNFEEDITSQISITGAVIGSQRSFLADFFKKLFSAITGRVVEESVSEQKEVEIEIDEVSTDYRIEYETPAPISSEEEIARGKKVTISGPENLHYENVLVFTNLSENLNVKNPQSVKIHWVENNTFISPSSVQDLNSNGIFDYIEWNVPHLSNQTFEIIVITKAEHLDSGRNFISDIYEQVKAQDDIWSETINDNEYVRVTFEIPLDNTRDITIYPRVASGTPQIEVYENNGTEKIAEFSQINSNELNKVLLTNLVGEQDTFDLRVIGGSIEIDYIVDPSNIYSINADALATATGVAVALQNVGKNIIRKNDNTLTAYWTNALGSDPSCSLSSTGGATWGTIQTETGTDEGVAIATNGTGVVYITESGGNGAGDIAYIYNVAGACDTVGTYVDVGLISLDNYRPDVAFDGVHNRYVVCSMDNDDFDIDFDYATPSVTTTLTWASVNALRPATSASCSIDVDDTGNVFIASNEGALGIIVYNSSAGTFATNTTVTAYAAAVNNMHLSIRGNTTLITANTTTNGLVLIWSTNGMTYQNATLTGLYSDPEGCVDANGNFHIVFANASSSTLSYVKYNTNGFSNPQNFADSGTERFPSVRCTNFPANNRMDSNDLELVFTDTGTNIYFANITVDTSAAADATSPQWFNNQTNSTGTAGAYIQHSVRWTDLNLNGYIFSFDNGTGTFTNDTWASMTGAANWSNVSKVVNSTGGSTIRWQVYANDSTNNRNATDIFSYVTVADNPPKWFTPTVNNTIPLPNVLVIHGVNWTDDNGLSYAILEVNGTGAGCDTVANVTTNSTFAGKTNWSNMTWQIPNFCEGKPIGWKQYANDTANQWNATTSQTYIVGSIAPVVSFGTNPVDNYNSSSSSVTFDLKVSDNNLVNGLRLYGNWTGSWVANQTNSSPINNSWWNVTVGAIPEGRWLWAAWGNDTAGNSTFTATNRTLTIDSTPPVVTLPVYANATKYRNNQNLIYNVSVVDSITRASFCAINVNGGANSTVAVSNNWCNGTYALTGLIDGNKTINAYANDTLGNTALNNSYVIWIDTTPPYFTALVNQTSYNNESLSYDINAADDGVGLSSFAIDDTTNFSINPSTGIITNITALVAYYYNVNVSVNDTLGNLNWSWWSLNVTATAIPNAAPTVSFIYVNTSYDPTIGTTKSITFNFTASDTNGPNDINVSSGAAYFQRTGETTRSNTSCQNYAAVGNSINLSCTINMWYYDQNGAWTINATIKDNSELYAENSSTTFTYNLLTAMVMSPNSINWATINLTSINIGSNTDPVTINNSGNDEPLNINITAFNLRGEQTTTQFIFANNFTIENVAEGCSGTAMVNATSTNVTSAILQRGNNSLNYNNATSGQEQIYFCLKGVLPDISAQAYSSAAYGAWTVTVLFAAIIPAKRKRKKKKFSGNAKLSALKENKLLGALDLIIDQIKEDSGLKGKEITERIIERLSDKYNLSKKEILDIVGEKISIPVTIFSKELGALESLVKYMKENLKMTYSEIARAIMRDERTIWTAYKKAAEKQESGFEIKETKILISLSVLADRRLTILESLILHLKEKGFKFSEIAKLLDRDQRNIWTIYSKAIKKLPGKN